MGLSQYVSPRRRLLFTVGLALLAAAQSAHAANYEFLAAPETDLNRVYRLDRATGEIGACQYGLKGSSASRYAIRRGKVPVRRRRANTPWSRPITRAKGASSGSICAPA